MRSPAGKPDRAVILGTLSLVIWTLIIVTTIKYVSFAMRIDNDGEGGILALMSLLGVKLKPRPVIVALGLLGAALIYGDGAVTPAISVLSAVEGLNIVAPLFSPYVLASAVVILVALFFIQSQGTARIGRAFGPIMLTWFVTIGLLGIWGIARHPSVLLAVNPIYAISYLHSSGVTGFLVLGGVFLCVTGAEALYADMGHFGARPIRLAWSALVFPSLVLNYSGQAALVLEGAPTSDNIFYRLCPSALLIPLVVLATIATIIASQSIITGAFSMTRQAIQLGWLPRLKITQTSAEGYGQIYVGAVNWTLMVVTCGLALAFGKSDNLAAAYGIAVSATMLATSALLFIAMREIWGWGVLRAGGIAGAFIIVDADFFCRQFFEDCLRRICATPPGGICLWHHAHLAPWSQSCFRTASEGGHSYRRIHGGYCAKTNSPGAGNGGLSHTHQGGRPSVDGVAPQPQPGASPTPVRAHG